MSHLTGSLTASQEGVHPGTGTGRGNFKLNSPRQITKEAKEELALMEKHIRQSFSTWLDYDQPVSLYIYSPLNIRPLQL